MADRLQTNLGLIRSLIERAPDHTVRDLETALGGDMGGPALMGVRTMVEAEAADRKARDLIFAPLKPLFGARGDGVAQLTFPATSLGRLWRALKAAAPAETAAARLARADEAAPPAWDDLCLLAADALRRRAEPEFAALAESLDADLPGGAQHLAGCLEITPLARVAVANLGDWLQRMTDERAATVRLSYKDAVAVSADGGPRLFEILFSNLQEPWLILRLISAIMDRPGDNYVSSSELGVFGIRLLDEIERRLDGVRRFEFDGGPDAAEAACADTRMICAIAEEMEHTLNVAREGPWGARLGRQKAATAKAVEGFLKKADGVLAAALPLAPVRIGGRTVRMAPKLDLPPDPRAMRRARAALTLSEQVRSAAQSGGFSALRSKVCEELEHRLNSYVEDLLHTIHDPEGDDAGAACARLYVEEIADLMGRVRDQKAAQIVRRRAAAA